MHLPSQGFHHGIAQLCGGRRFTMHEVSFAWRTLESVQPLQQFRSVGVIAELFQGRHLRANRNLLTENLHLGGAILDGEPASAWRLEADEQYQVLRVGKPLHQVMQHAPAGNHPAR